MGVQDLGVPMGLLDRFRKRRAVRAFIRRLGPALRERHGHGPPYSAGQIEAAMRSDELRRHREYALYAYCLFMSHDDFEALEPGAGAPADYGAMRIEAYGLVGPGAGAEPPAAGAYGDAFFDPSGGDAGGGDGGVGL